MMTTTMEDDRRTRRSPAFLARLAAVVLAVLLVGWLVVEQSRSAFTDTTDNTGNLLTTGTVVLSDDDGGTALFNAANLVPGQSRANCIEVSYEGSLPAGEAIKLYGSYADGDHSLAQYLNLNIEVGEAGSDCDSFSAETTRTVTTLAVFTGAPGGWENGYVTGWTPQAATSEAPEMRPFRITLTVRDDNAAQGKSARPAFTWEVRS